MKKSLISLAVISVSGQAHVVTDDKRPKAVPADRRPIHIGSTASPGEQTNELSGFSLPTAKDLHPGGLPMLQSNDERFSGIPDGDGVTQWPNPGKSIVYAGQQDRHTPAWMAAVSRRPLNVAARA